MPWRELEKHTDANSLQIYRAVIEGTPAMLWLGDANGKCVFLNKMLRDFWGVSLEDIPSFDWTGSVHPDDVARLAGPFRAAMETQTPMQVEARYRRADGVYRILRTSAEPRFSETGEFLGMVGVNTDVTEQRENEETLRQTMESLSLATKASRLGWGTWDTGAGTAEWDTRGREILGLPQGAVTAEDWFQRVHPEDRAVLQGEIDACVEGHRAFDVIYRVCHPDGTVVRVHGTGSLERTSGGVTGTGMVRDVTEQAREEEFKQLVIQELGHRIKNLLGLVSSLVSQTRATGDVAEFKSALQGRLRALGASLGSVGGAGQGGAETTDLHELSEAVLRPYLLDRPDSIRISGPRLRLPARHGRIVGLALHELTTNAVKYGALSCPGGHVELSWAFDDAADCNRLDVVWSEVGGPPVTPPEERGFGSRLLQEIIALETGAGSDLDFASTGIRYTLNLPIERAPATPHHDHARDRQARAAS